MIRGSALIVGAVAAAIVQENHAPSRLDDFADGCLGDSRRLFVISNRWDRRSRPPSIAEARGGFDDAHRPVDAVVLGNMTAEQDAHPGAAIPRRAWSR